MIEQVLFTAQNFRVDWDEDGCYLVIATDEASLLRFKVTDPEQLYDAVKGGIGPWLRERDEARSTMPPSYDVREAYDVSDPKHPDFYSVHVDHYDNREKVQ